MTTSLSSRGTLGWLGALLAGGMSAAAFGFAFSHAETMLVFLAYIAALPLFVAGLGAGILPGALAGLAATAGLYLKTSPALALGYFMANALPVVALITLSLRYRKGEDKKIYWYPEGYLLTAVVLYPSLIFLAALGLASGAEGGLLGQTTQMIQGGTAAISETMEPDMAANFKIMADMLPRVLPALMGCGWIFLMLASVLAAQSILKQQNWNLRDAFNWRDMQIPTGLLIAAAVTGLAGVFGGATLGYAGMNLCFMLCIPFFFVGLAVAHAYAATRKMGLYLLIPLYIFLSFLPWLALVVTLVGALDQGFHFRQRLAALPQRSDKQGEDQ